MEETERSLHDAIMIVRRAIKNDTVVAGKLILTTWRPFSYDLYCPVGHKVTILAGNA